MRCPRCKATNRADRRFCLDCGAVLGVECPQCRFINATRARFCGGCGRALAASAAAHDEPAGEPAAGDGAPARAAQPDEAARRQVTVVFSDLVGSTALSGQLDVEDMHLVIRTFQAASKAVVDRFGGFVARYMGDGVLIYFGYPKAHEDDAERAVRCGLEIVRAVNAIEAAPLRALGTRLSVRVGIATGVVVVGELIGEGASEETPVVGETPNRAARLQQLAAPDSVVISDATAHVVSGLFELRDLGACRVKGVAGDIRAWQAVRQVAGRSRFEVMHRGGLAPLVGRAEEVELLRRRWERAERSEGQVVLLTGEAGIGKSRIIRALRDHVRGRAHYTLDYQCSALYGNTSLYPFIEQFKRAAGIAPEDTAGQRLERLRALIAATAPGLAHEIPVFATLLSLPSGQRDAHDPTPVEQRRHTFSALGELLGALTVSKPVLAVVEDAHWVDPSSQEFLDLLVQEAPAKHVLVVVAARSGYWPPWVGQAHVSVVMLNRFDRHDGAALVRGVAGDKPLPGALVEQILARADGVPLFLEGLTQMVLDTGLLVEGADRYELSGPLPSLAIPSTLHDSLMSRLDQLVPVRRISQIAAAIGREFSLRLLAAATGVDGEALGADLDRLVESRLLLQRGAPPHTVYAFRHALVQETAYASMLRDQRRHQHGRIAEALEAGFPEVVDTEPETLAHHFTEAGRPERAARYWMRAGERALEHAALVEAGEHFDKALSALATLPASAERTGLERAALRQRAASLRAMGREREAGLLDESLRRLETQSTGTG